VQEWRLASKKEHWVIITSSGVNSIFSRRNSFHLNLPNEMGDHDEERSKMNRKDDESKMSDRSDDHNQMPTPSITPTPSPGLEMQQEPNSAPSSG